jgi:hypothetical protein
VPTTATPNILTDPGYLFWAPGLTAVPTMTALASKFTDAWPAAWISLGATEEGSQFSYQMSVEAITVAEFFDPIRYSTTGRTSSFAFNLADYTLANWKRAANGGTLSVVSGTTTTAINRFDFPDPGSEVRSAIGWESLDGTMRIIGRQAFNGGEITSAFRKAPAFSVIPCQFGFEVPTGDKPVALFSAGSSRALT